LAFCKTAIVGQASTPARVFFALVVMGPRDFPYTDLIFVYGMWMDEKPRRGRPPKSDAKVAVTLRLYPDLVAAFQARDTEWRRQMEDALAAFVAATFRGGEMVAAHLATGVDLDAVGEAVGAKPRSGAQPDADYRKGVLDRIGVQVGPTEARPGERLKTGKKK
jgi:uncharacterized protein (DUF4415 family)